MAIPPDPLNPLLRHALTRRDPADADACPDAEMLAAFTEGTLSNDERGVVETHAASCSRCSHVLALLAGADEGRSDVADTAVPWWRQWRWAATFATAAVTAIIIWFANPPRLNEPARITVSPTAAPPAAPAPAAPPPETEARNATPQQTLQDAAQKPAPSPDAAASADRTTSLRRERRQERDGDRPASLAETVTVDARASAAAPPLVPLLVASGNSARQWRIQGLVIDVSNDAGNTWTREHTAPRVVLAGRAVSQDVVWMVGREGLVLRRTTDGWSTVAAPAPADLTGIETATATELVVRTADGRAFATADAGASWLPR